MEKKTKSRRRREFIRQFYRGNIVPFVLGIVQVFVMAASNLLLSWLLQQLIDVATGTQMQHSFGQLAGLSVLTLGMLALAYFLAYHSKPRFYARAIGQYKEYAFRQIARKSISAFSGENTSTYISALSNDANSIEMDYLVNTFLIIDNVTMFIGALAMMLWYSVPLTLIGLGFSLLPVLGSVLAGNRVAEAEKQVSEKNETYMSALKDSLTGFSVVKAFRAEAELCRLLARNIREVSEAKEHRRKMSTLVNALGTVGGCIAQIGVFVVGAWLALTGRGISPGVVIAFVQLMNWVVNPIGTVPQYLAEYKAASALIDKLAQALDTNLREEGEPIPARLEEGITVENLTFGYGEEPVLKDVSCQFEAGKSYAIVGASGSGKSTLLNLLMAAHDSYDGEILYDGAELRSVSCGSLYELVSMVQQNVFVFNASIRDNITMFREFPKEEVDRAIQLSGLTELITERGEGYLCGENGSGLSGGEKQRISIARSLLKKSAVLLVDEATAALDAQTAWQVTSSILNLDGLTRIVVTHALDEGLLKQCDGILALKAGKIAETGTFGELMEKKGYFYSLYTVSQA